MRSNRGYLDVVVPPSIIDSKSSPDLVVKEGAVVNLTCAAHGSPTPKGPFINDAHSNQAFCVEKQPDTTQKY